MFNKTNQETLQIGRKYVCESFCLPRIQSIPSLNRQPKTKQAWTIANGALRWSEVMDFPSLLTNRPSARCSNTAVTIRSTDISEDSQRAWTALHISALCQHQPNRSACTSILVHPSHRRLHCSVVKYCMHQGKLLYSWSSQQVCLRKFKSAAYLKQMQKKVFESRCLTWTAH